MKEDWKDSLEKHPENAFLDKDLTYKSSEIVRIFNEFNMALISKPVYQVVQDLLNATVKFRYATDPEAFYKELRARTKTDKELANIFSDMNAALLKANSQFASLNDEDKKILDLALVYSKKSITKRMEAVQADDCLVPFWKTSELKKQLV